MYPEFDDRIRLIEQEPKQRTGRGGVFGQGLRLSSKNLGKKLIPGQGAAPETIEPALSRQQRRLAARRRSLS